MEVQVSNKESEQAEIMASRVEEDVAPLLPNHNLNSNVNLDAPVTPTVSVYRLWKNLLCLCISCTLVFTSYLSLQNLESTLNSEAGLGVISLSCVYAAVFVSGLFAPLIIKYISCKWAIVLGVAAQTVFVACNWYPTYFTLIPGSLILGLCSSVFWTGQGTYLTNLAVDYAQVQQLDVNQILTRFNGLFYFFFQDSQIIGNLISSLVLDHGNDSTVNVNVTCGFHHCNDIESNNASTSNISTKDVISNSQQTSQKLVFILIGIYLAFDVIAFFLTSCFLDNRHVNSPVVTFKQSMKSTFKYHQHKWIIMMLPLFVYNGMEQIYLFAEYTNSFPGCVLGLGYIGYVMISFGVSNALVSLIVDRVAKICGRIVIFTVPFIIHTALLLAIIFWTPTANGGAEVLFYVIPALWGIADAILQAMTPALLGAEFSTDLEPVFAIYRMWQALGFAILGISSPYICMDVKTYMVMSLLGISAIAYYIAEFDIRRSRKH